MSRLLIGATALLCSLSAGGVFADGIERIAPTTRALFEPGRYLEFTGRFVNPDLTGTGGIAANTGDLLESFASIGAAYKADINEQLSYAVIFDNPWGVDTNYPTGVASGYVGTTAELDSYAITGILAYDVMPNVKVYGGVRVQTMEATAAIPFIAGYTVDANQDIGFGYLVGAAYSKPEIALRVALTYYSEIDHTLDTTEVSGAGTMVATTDLTTPQAVNLEFQTGIAADTLLFGSIYWADWSNFTLSPPQYTGVLVGSPLVAYTEDWTTYSLGIGRRFTDEWSGAVLASYEPATETILTTLGPIDGKTSLGVAVTRTMGNTKITGGISYVWIGDATNILGTRFSDGNAIVVGFRIAMQL